MSLKSQIKKIILENQILNKNFWNWFGNSKVFENNKPLVVYHGTNENFNVFDNSKIGYNSGNFGHYGYGFYFSIDEREAKNYGKNIIKCFLKIENPFTGTEEQIKLLKKHNIGRVDDLVETNIDFNSLALALLKVDKKLYEFIILLKEKGLEKGWEIFIEKNNDFINQNSETLNDLSDILEYTNEDSKEIPDFVFDLLKNIGIEKKDLKINTGFSIEQSLHWITDLGNQSKHFTEGIVKLGFDGIIYGSEYVAISPSQIKSVSNDGSFDIEDNNIFS